MSQRVIYHQTIPPTPFATVAPVAETRRVLHERAHMNPSFTQRPTQRPRGDTPYPPRVTSWWNQSHSGYEMPASFANGYNR